jgi:hypothetical protein
MGPRPGLTGDPKTAEVVAALASGELADLAMAPFAPRRYQR